MTESMPIAANPPDGGRKLQAVGPSAGPIIRILNDDGSAVSTPQGEAEICVHGACVTKGYEYRPHNSRVIFVAQISADRSPSKYISRTSGKIWCTVALYKFDPRPHTHKPLHTRPSMQHTRVRDNPPLTLL